MANQEHQEMTSSSMPVQKTKVVYFVRHAEATHNILERQAVQKVVQAGVTSTVEQENARRAVLQDESLRDAPLSVAGSQQASQVGSFLSVLHKADFGNRYPAPRMVLVSPLRRALMTATKLFLDENDEHNPRKPIFVAMESLREKRTGFAADERSSVDQLEQEFPHVDFSDLRRCQEEILPGEDNASVQRRGRDFLTGSLMNCPYNSVALVTHKGWLREMRKTLREWVDSEQLKVDFDLKGDWDKTLFGNSEVRVAQFGWTDDKVTSIVSKSIENALQTVVQDAVLHLIENNKTASTAAATAADTSTTSFENSLGLVVEDAVKHLITAAAVAHNPDPARKCTPTTSNSSININIENPPVTP